MKNDKFSVGSIKLLRIFAFIAVIIFLMTACDTDYDSNESGTGSGVNLGIIAFGDNRIERPIQLLTSQNSTSFHNFIDNLVMEDGTSLYLAVDQAITMLTNASLPSDLANVSIVTFTDGLDNVSLHNPHPSHAAWRTHLSQRIADTRIQGHNINAYSIGIKGSDVTDEANFSEGLRAIASSSANVTQVTEMSDVTARFQQIANSLYESNTTHSVSLRIPIGYEDGATIRFTFDITSAEGNPNVSTLYIEGRFTVAGSVFSLTNITQQGLTHTSGTSITGTRSGNFVTFTFNNIERTGSGGSINVSNTRHWFRNPSASTLGPNVEFNPDSDSETTISRSSAVIVLVLDRTTSLGQTQFGQMKTAAKNFVSILASGNNGGTPPPPPPTGDGTILHPFQLTMGTWANGVINSSTPYYDSWGDRIVFYSFPVVNGTTYRIWWSNSWRGNGTHTLDTNATAYYQDGTDIFFFDINEGWTSPQVFIANRTGTVVVMKYPYYQGDTGTFALVYSTSSTRPSGP